MGKRGQTPQGKVDIRWSANFAYAIGLLVTDGNLSSDGRHIIFVSKDMEQINNFLKCLKRANAFRSRKKIAEGRFELPTLPA